MAVPVADLGGATSLVVPADGLARTYTLQVPKGLRPTAIRADWQRTADVANGSLTVEQGRRSIAEAGVGGDDGAPLIAASKTITLANPKVDGNAFTFDLRLRPANDSAVCSTVIGDGNVTLIDPELIFDGTDTTGAVSDFLPTALQRLVVSVPATPTAGQAQAAIDIADVAVRSYGLDPAKIEVTDTTTPVDLGPLERRVVINATEKVGINVQQRTASIGGDDATILKNVGLFGTMAESLPQVSASAVNTLTTTVDPNRTRYSFDDLGVGSVNLDGVGRIERTLSFSQANLGGPVHNWSVRLVGNYQPQVSRIHNNPAAFSVLTNGTLLRSIPLDESGRLDVTVPIPDALAGRDPSLTLRFDTQPADGSCAAVTPFTASIDSRSAVDVERGDGAVASGFTRWPQAALPTLNVGIDDMTVDALSATVTTIASLQAVTTKSLNVVVAPSLTSSLASPRLAVVTQTTVPDYLDATLPGGGVKLVGDNNQEIVNLSADETLTSLQAYEHSGGETLLLTGPTASDVKSLAGTLAGQTNGWFSLRGDTWFKAGNHEPAAIQARGGALRVEPVAPEASTVISRYRAEFIIGAIILVVVLLALLYPRMVQSRPGGPETRQHGGSPGGRRSTDRVPMSDVKIIDPPASGSNDTES